MTKQDPTDRIKETMTRACAVEGLHYCGTCFSWAYSSDKDVEYDLMAASDFPAEPVPCEQCAVEDVFYRKTYTALDLSDESWLIPWPTEPDRYWFHGWLNGDDGSSPRTFLVELIRVYSGNILTSTSRLVGLTEGVVLSRSTACGVWYPQPAKLPVPPQTPKGEA